MNNALNYGEFKVVAVGDGSTGKTGLLTQTYAEVTIPTVFDQYSKDVAHKGRSYSLQLFDTAGQEDYAAIRDNYFRSGEGFLCVFSITEDDSFQSTQEFREQILRVKGDTNIPFILVGNKADLTNSRKVQQATAQNRAAQWQVSNENTSVIIQ